MEELYSEERLYREGLEARDGLLDDESLVGIGGREIGVDILDETQYLQR